MKNFIFLIALAFSSYLHSDEDKMDQVLETISESQSDLYIDEDEIDQAPENISESQSDVHIDEDKMDQVLETISESQSDLYSSGDEMVARSQSSKCLFPKIKGIIEGKAGYFRPDSKVFRKIYSGGAIYGLEGTFQAYKALYPWISANYFSKSGKTITGDLPTKVYIGFFEIGLKYIFPINKYSDSLYVGIGALPTYLYVHDNSEFLIKKTIKWYIGGVVKGGLLVNIYRKFFLDIFADYKYIKMSFKSPPSNKVVFRTRANLSGITVGGALGIRF